MADERRVSFRQFNLEIIQAMVDYFAALPCEKVMRSAGKTAGVIASAPIALEAGVVASPIVTPVGGFFVATGVLGAGMAAGDKAGEAMANTVCPLIQNKSKVPDFSS